MRLRILHVDDEPDFTDMAAAFLERQNDRFTVETATKAEEGLERLGENEYDCVVSDYDMPGKNGIEFLKEVRDSFPELPFILFTGKGSEEVASEAISEGVTDYLQKSSGTEEYKLLTNRIENAVRARRNAKRAERQDELMRLTEVAGNTGGFELDVETGKLFLTDGARRIAGVPEGEDFYIEDAIESYHPDDRERVREILGRVTETGKKAHGVFRSQVGEEGERLLDITVTPVKDNGKVTKIRGSLNDITEQRERQHELEQIEKLFENAQDSLFLVDVGEDFILKRVNPAYEDATGLSAEDLSGRKPRDIFGEDGAEMEEKYADCVEKKEPLEYDERVLLDGELTYWETKIAPVVLDGEVEYIAGAAREVTERKERQKELKRYEKLIENSSDVIIHIDENGEMVYLSPGLERILGREPEDRVGKNAFEYIHPDDRERTIEEFHSLTKDTKRELEEIEIRMENDDGEYVWIEVGATDQTDTELGGVIASLRDITERKERERELERHEAFIENSSDMVTHMDTDGNVLYLSPAAERIMGRDTEARRGEGAFEYVHPEDREGIAEEFRSFLEDPEKETKEVVYRSQREDGEYIWLETLAVDMTDTDIGGVIASSRDVTERKRKKERLQRQKERLDEFAGVLSHDLRNPLAVAKGRLELAQKDCDSDHLDRLEGALGRMETLIEDVLTLAREGSDVGEMEVIETEEFVEDCWSNVETETATLVNELERRIEADPGRFKQLCENLLRNAIEHGGDDVTVTVGELEDKSGFYVADDGEGIPEGKREDVFETGYSTSEDGTGFGLSIVKRIVTAHGWEIEVTESETGGARFEISGIRLPEE